MLKLTLLPATQSRIIVWSNRKSQLYCSNKYYDYSPFAMSILSGKRSHLNSFAHQEHLLVKMQIKSSDTKPSKLTYIMFAQICTKGMSWHKAICNTAIYIIRFRAITSSRSKNRKIAFWRSEEDFAHWNPIKF